MRATITAGQASRLPRARPRKSSTGSRPFPKKSSRTPNISRPSRTLNATPDYSTGEAWMKQLKEQYAEMNKVLTDLGLTGNK